MEVHGWFGPATGSNLVGGMVDFGTGMAANHRSTWRWPWFRAQSCGQARLSRLCASGKISKRNRFKCLEEAWPRWQSWLRLQAELRDFLFWSVGTVGNEVPCPAEVQKNLMIGYDGQFPSGLNERPIMWRSRLEKPYIPSAKHLSEIECVDVAGGKWQVCIEGNDGEVFGSALDACGLPLRESDVSQIWSVH